MEFATQKSIKRGEIWNVEIPNLKEWCLVPDRVEFWSQPRATANGAVPPPAASEAETTDAEAAQVPPPSPGCGDIEVSLSSAQNCLYRWGLPYFKVYTHLELGLFLQKIGEGENIGLSIKNVDKSEQSILLKVIYRDYQGNIVYYNSYDNSLIQSEVSNPLQDLANAGMITQIQIQTEIKMQGVVLEPIFHVKDEESEAAAQKLNGFPLGAIVVEAEEPTSIIELGLEQLQEYQNALKYFRMRILWDETADPKETRKCQVHIVAHGFKR